ncbi:tRNA epoxyqueuosine(34) reductase QueG [Inediibacterium massiliense]|uniref:tRNA epoxyqueuosine(34) reductase QueG n=1 Tax=Inediibacterium massiliense TaxID=1658111 RepID=UPI0006B63579|nr:tRNA epoxyqueuosine(34) reductase QueG [Inediibacterium massiliense]
MKNKLKEFCREMNIEHVGIAPAEPYKELENILKKRIQKGYLTGFEEKEIQKRINPKEIMEDARSIIVCLFPYFIGNKESGNLSKYTYGLDYHKVIEEKLEKIGHFLKNEIKDFSYQSFVDNGPLVDRYLAYISGVGYFGMNHHIITDDYGSYVFIGYMINNYPFEVDSPSNKTCIECGKCIKSCPGGALLSNYEMNPKRCIAYLTQKKEALTDEEENILKKGKTIFGCDICQDVCPHNENVKITPLEEFKENIIHKIDETEIKNLSNKGFQKKYKDRSFSWRGRKTIQRNLYIFKDKE